jgi:hypothetical protein
VSASSTFRKLWESKKFRAALLGVVVTSAGITARHLGVDVERSEIALALAPITAYILGQGMADFGKEGKR